MCGLLNWILNVMKNCLNIGSSSWVVSVDVFVRCRLNWVVWFC